MVDAMYKMILKQLWNERKGNLFIWLEMLVVSIFLWYAADALFVMYRLYSQPLGFNIEHTYHVSFGVIPEESPDYDTTSVHSERGGGDYLTLMDRIRRNPSVESICFTTGVHFHYRGSNQYATFRKEMEQQLRVGNIYLKDVFPMSHYRDQFLERWLDQVRLYVAGIAFFLLNVLLGVVGTFWYRTQQRSAEIGLRMAMGATRKGIFWQLVKEGLALLTIAFIPSTVIFANLLHMEVTQGSEIPPDMASRLLFGFVFSYAVMAAMIVVGISFPSYRAMRMHPADALRQE